MAGLLLNGATVPDGVSSTGLHYLSSFPWLGDPWAGDAALSNRSINDED